MTKHWTQTKPKSPSLSGQVAMITNPDLREQQRCNAIDVYLYEYDTAKSQSHRNFIKGELERLGYDMDYRAEDSGNDYTNYEGK